MAKEYSTTDPRGFLEKERANLSEKVKHVHSSEDESRLESIRRTLKFLDSVPECYKTGPWSPVAYMVITAYAIFLVAMWGSAMNEYRALDHDEHGLPWLQIYRAAAGLYAIGNSALTLYAVGIWPFLSYTLTSWNLLAVRLLSAYLASQGFTAFGVLADIVRFPALVGCTITVCVWWGILVPMIDHLLKSNSTERKFFWSWNFSFTLINVHLLNLPMVALDFLLSAQRLSFFDLYMGLLVAFLYVLFYLNVLDPRGLHFYIILTPRSKLCIVSYGLILALYYGVYWFWNKMIV